MPSAMNPDASWNSEPVASPKKRPAPRGTAAYPRRRANRACQVCRARRTKCDNAKPKCGFCQKTGANCIQSAIDLSSFDPASLRILERLDELESVVRETGTASPGDEAPRKPPTSSAQRESLARLLPASLESLLSRTEDAPSPSLLKQLQTPSDSLNLFSPSSPLSIAVELDFRTTNSLLDNFFNYVHVKNPILQEENTRRMVSGICLHGIEWSLESCLALIICALGSCATPFGESSDVSPGSLAYAQSRSYFQAARKRIGLGMSSCTVLEAQCWFLAGVYMMHMFEPFNAWRSFCQSLSCCQGFDFLTETSSAHDLGRGYADFSTEQQVIYWSAWKSERELRSAIEPPDFALSVSTEALYPTFFPTPPPPSEANQYRALEVAFREQFSWYFYLTEISLKRLTSRIADDMLNHPPTKFSVLRSLASALKERETELAHWIDALPSQMRLEKSADLDDVCLFVIRGHVANVYEMIYWPFLTPYLGLENSSYDEMAKNDSEMRVLAEKALQAHVDRIILNRPGFKHRHHGTWPMIRSCTRSLMVLIKCATSLPMPVGWVEAAQEVIELNRYWQLESADARCRVPFLEKALQHVLDNLIPQEPQPFS
jgi:Fungal Zn(2)-Cys(6) binuclear cluster domain